MKVVIFLITIILTANAFANDYVVLPETNVKYLLNPCSRDAPSYEGTFSPTKEEIALLEKNLNKLITIESSECCGAGKIEGSISDYFRQYVGIYINSKKYIYINASKKSSVKISKKIIFACDGGKDFWGALFDLTEANFSNIAFNGES